MKEKTRTERKRPPAAIIDLICAVCLHYPWSTAVRDVLTASCITWSPGR